LKDGREFKFELKWNEVEKRVQNPILDSRKNSIFKEKEERRRERGRKEEGRKMKNPNSVFSVICT